VPAPRSVGVEPTGHEGDYRYNASGVFLGSQKVTAALELGANGDEFASRSVIEILDVNDNVIGIGCATAVGTRSE
jgi:hypothetical protein